MEIVTAILILTIVSLSSIAMVLPSLDTTRVVMKIVEYEYNYDNSQLALVALLSNREVYQKLSYYISDLPDKANVFSKAGTKALLTDKLDKLVESKCYKLSYSGGVIVKSQDADSLSCKPGYNATTFIALPYGTNTNKNNFGKIELLIG